MSWHSANIVKHVCILDINEKEWNQSNRKKYWERSPECHGDKNNIKNIGVPEMDFKLISTKKINIALDTNLLGCEILLSIDSIFLLFIFLVKSWKNLNNKGSNRIQYHGFYDQSTNNVEPSFIKILVLTTCKHLW